jgi:hypothetical protein
MQNRSMPQHAHYSYIILIYIYSYIYINFIYLFIMRKGIINTIQLLCVTLLISLIKTYDDIYDYPKDTKIPPDHQQKFKIKINQLKNFCFMKETNILNKTIVEKLNIFKKSNCPPVVLIPGFMGSKLEFRMKNCTEFKHYHKNVMKSCGWNNCMVKELKRFTIWLPIKIDYGEIINSVFSSEPGQKEIKDKVYIPNIIREIVIDQNVIKFPHKEECLGNLLRIYYKKINNTDTDSNSYSYEIENFRGAEIRTMKSDKKECGADVISNMIGDTLSLSREYQGYASLNENLHIIGYTKGVTLFNFPYDFRLPIDKIAKELDKTIKLAYKITKKKPIII